LDGVQKMSKSLGNAIGITEPPLEMYGKIMSISDEMMWRYYELLTDVQTAEIEKMRREAHPMQAKKELARHIMSDFHSGEAAAKAGEDWAKQFQKDETPEDVEEVPVKFEDVLPIPISEIEWSSGKSTGEWTVQGKSYRGIRLDRLLVKCGLAESGSDAARKLKEGAVKVNNHPAGMHVLVDRLPEKLSLRLGKRIKIAVIHR
jgi:tyrosyl-tRNA synthetase